MVVVVVRCHWDWGSYLSRTTVPAAPGSVCRSPRGHVGSPPAGPDRGKHVQREGDATALCLLLAGPLLAGGSRSLPGLPPPAGPVLEGIAGGGGCECLLGVMPSGLGGNVGAFQASRGQPIVLRYFGFVL